MSIPFSYRQLALAISAALCQVCVPAQAFAADASPDAESTQAAPTAPAASTAPVDTGVTLAPVVITAQHREESMQNVPISVTSISGKALEDSGYQSLTDLQYLVPGLQYDPTQGAAFQIRGVGSESFDFSNAKSVNIVVDDVVMDAQRDNGLTGMVDIQRVDVLMGPQGTLFGKNSTSGVVMVTTGDPELGEKQVKASVSYGQRNDHILNTTLNLPLNETSALRVSAFDQGQNGYGNYVLYNDKLGTVKEYGFRAKLLVKPDGVFDAILATDYEYHWDNSIRTAVSGAPASVTAQEIALGVTPGPQNASTADSSRGMIQTKEWGASLRMHYKFDDAKLTSITAYRGTVYDNNTPADLLPGNEYAYIPYNDGALKTNKFSQELRLASTTGKFMEYVGGLFFNRLSAQQSQLQWATLGAPLVSANGTPNTSLYALTGAIGQNGNTALFNAVDTTGAAYGQLKFNFTDKFNLALGGRYTYDRNSQSLGYFNTPTVPITGQNDTFTATSAAPLYPSGSISGQNFSFRVSPEFKYADNAMVYATYSTGFKPGGIAFVSNHFDPYKAETVQSFEVGHKAEYFDHRLRLNVDAFLEKFTNFQASTLTSIPGSPLQQIVIGNAGGLKSQGIEASAAWRATRSLTLNGAVTYDDAYFTNYIYNTTTNYTGSMLTNAPRWAASLSADYKHVVGENTMMKAHVDYTYRGKLWTVVGQPAYSEVPGYSLVNARVSFKAANSDFEYGVYARNLFNTYFSTGWQQYGALGLLHYTSPDAYRTIGVFAKYEY